MKRGDKVKISYEATFYQGRHDGYEVNIDSGHIVFVPKSAKVEQVISEDDYPQGTVIRQGDTLRYVRTAEGWWNMLHPFSFREWEVVENFIRKNPHVVVKP